MSEADSMEWTRAAKLEDLGEGEVLSVEVDGLEIALYRVKGQVYATENICTHALAKLSDGLVDGYSIECPLHGGRFDIRTGKGLCEPITQDIKTYAVRVVGDEIQVSIWNT